MKNKFNSLFQVLICLFVFCGCQQDKNLERNFSFDEGWLFRRGQVLNGERTDLNDTDWRIVNIPHDWSIEDIPETQSPFSKDAVSEVSTGFTVGGEGWYRKHFTIEDGCRGKRVYVNFDGIYMNADIWVNNQFVANHMYGYTGFELDITPYIKYGASNLIAVRVRNEEQNCRWYSGSGIYRHTMLKVVDPIHFKTGGTFITTPVVDTHVSTVEVEHTIANHGLAVENMGLIVSIFDADDKQVAQTKQALVLNGEKELQTQVSLEVKAPHLWSVDNPYLYTVVSKVVKDNDVIDQERTTIGIRSIEFSAQDGFQLNGQSMKLKGGCIHHDHGMLGAKAFYRAEERKVQLLKDAGFNALRLSHNPPSTALLDVCDRLGMLVIDEAFDMWTIGHYKHDYAQYFDSLWRDDLSSMLLRDRNHPSIIMWSIGNEIKQKDTQEVAHLSAELSDYVRLFDTTRPVTAGVNSITDQTDSFIAPLDVCGYNYGLDRYEYDGKRCPDRIIYASESYSSMAYDYWKGVTDHSYVIGDFVWTAYDYIGEASIGWCGYPLDKRIFPWNHAYCGDIDLMGERRPQSYLRESVWNNQLMAYIAVTPPEPSFPLNPDKADWSIWDFPDAVHHWNFAGYEGKPLQVSVYTNGEKAELLLNGNSLGVQENTSEHKNVLTWEVPYEPGCIKVIAYQNETQVVHNLQTIGEPTQLLVSADRTALKADGQDLSYVHIRLADQFGRPHPLSEKQLQFNLSGDAVIEGVGNANPMSIESFTASHRLTWRGSAWLVIRSGKQPGPISLTVSTTGMENITLRLEQK